MSEVTDIMARAAREEPKAAEELLPLVYEELRRLAAARLAGEAPGHTLQPTALVHEAWLRLTGDSARPWDGRGHFFAAAAEAMRRILIDRARRRKAQRRGGGLRPVNIDDLDIAAEDVGDQLLALSEALDLLTVKHKAQADLVKLRYFGGFTNDEAAQLLDIPPRTAIQYWNHARAWLLLEMKKQKDALRR